MDEAAPSTSVGLAATVGVGVLNTDATAPLHGNAGQTVALPQDPRSLSGDS